MDRQVRLEIKDNQVLLVPRGILAHTVQSDQLVNWDRQDRPEL